MTSETSSKRRGVLRPVFQRIIVKRVEADEKIGSIIIPDAAKVKPTLGKIIAVGEEAEEQGFCPGQTILFGRYSGFDYEWNGENVLIMNSEDVVAIEEDECDE